MWSSVPPGSRITWIVSLSGVTPSHWYVPEWNGDALVTVSVAGELVRAPDLPPHVAVVTPFCPRLVSSTFHGAVVATQSVVPLRWTPPGFPAETVIGEAAVIFATEAELKVEETP